MLVMHGRRSSCKIRVPTKIEIRAFISLIILTLLRGEKPT